MSDAKVVPNGRIVPDGLILVKFEDGETREALACNSGGYDCSILELQLENENEVVIAGTQDGCRGSATVEKVGEAYRYVFHYGLDGRRLETPELELGDDQVVWVLDDGRKFTITWRD